MLDHAEVGRWLEASDDEAGPAAALVDLNGVQRRRPPRRAVAQLALKGPLRGVGELHACLAVLERDDMPSRNVDATAGGPPPGNDSRDDAAG